MNSFPATEFSSKVMEQSPALRLWKRRLNGSGKGLPNDFSGTACLAVRLPPASSCKRKAINSLPTLTCDLTWAPGLFSSLSHITPLFFLFIQIQAVLTPELAKPPIGHILPHLLAGLVSLSLKPQFRVASSELVSSVFPPSSHLSASLFCFLLGLFFARFHSKGREFAICLRHRQQGSMVHRAKLMVRRRER